MNNNIPVIVNLRGVAAISVALSHFICSVTGFISNEKIIKIFDYGGEGVRLFFVISSIVIPIMLINSNYNFSKFFIYLLKRFIRIYPTFFISVIIYFLFWYIRFMLKNDGYLPGINDLINNLLFTVPFTKGIWFNNIYWTLSVEVGFYIFIGLIFPFALKNFFYRIMFYLSFYILQFTQNFYSTTHLFNYWAIYFLPGVVYVLWKFKKISNNEFLLLLLFSSISIVFFFGWLKFFILTATILIIHTASNYNNKIFYFLGEISYSLYLLHPLGLSFLNLFYKYKYFEGFSGKIILLLLSFFLTVFMSYLYYLIFEKPFHKISKRIR